MLSESAKILLTGLPRCGKTTAVMKIIANLKSDKIAGFYTQEIRQGRVRKGFSWRRLDGITGTLAHIDIKAPFRVGKYGVDVAVLATVALKGAGLISEVKNDPNTRLFNLTRHNSEKTIDEILQSLCFLKK